MVELKTNDEWFPYACDKEGTVLKNIVTGNILKCYIGTHGYKMFRSLRVKQSVLYHRLVASVWVDNPFKYPVVNHKDHNKLNNNSANLEWCTHKHNTQEAVKFGVMPINCKYGEECNLAEYSDEKVHQICKDLQEGISNKEVSLKYNISTGYIKDLKNKKVRKGIASQYELVKKDIRILSDDLVHEICKLIVDGLGNKDIVEYLNHPFVKNFTIKNIKRKTSYKDIADQYF